MWARASLPRNISGVPDTIESQPPIWARASLPRSPSHLPGTCVVSTTHVGEGIFATVCSSFASRNCLNHPCGRGKCTWGISAPNQARHVGRARLRIIRQEDQGLSACWQKRLGAATSFRSGRRGAAAPRLNTIPVRIRGFRCASPTATRRVRATPLPVVADESAL